MLPIHSHFCFKKLKFDDFLILALYHHKMPLFVLKKLTLLKTQFKHNA
jgi:hypothetical protein